MRYILYARKSSESEDRQIQSIDDQLRILRELATRQGISIVEEILESRSAKAPGVRTEFAKMLRLIEKGKADAILCWSVNRLSRNPVDSGLLSWMLQTGGLKCIQTPERVYLPEDNVLLFAVETGVANQFILDLKKAVHRGMQSKIEKGWFPHRAPEGYENNLREHTIERDPERFPLLLRAWSLLLEERKSLTELTRILNEEWGYKTRAQRNSPSAPLSISSAHRIFSNPFYAGYFWHGGQLHKGLHPPMISLDEFERAQKHLHGKFGGRQRQKHNFAYSGMVVCSRCGRKLVAELQKGRLKRGEWVYYHCSNVEGKCDKKSVRQDVLEARITACLQSVTIVPEFKQLVLESLEAWIKVEFGSHELLYGNQLKALAENERHQNELFEMRIRQLIDDEQFRAKQSALRLENARLHERVSGTERKIEILRATIENAMEFRLHAREEFMVGNSEKRRAIAQSLGVKYVYDRGDVAIELHPLLAYHSAPQMGAIEPRIIGSGTEKNDNSVSIISFGRGSGMHLEPILRDQNDLKQLFRDVFNGVMQWLSIPFAVGELHDP